ncbi:MAG TPA: helical backbone metal receptor [Gemmatimonadales bacterium]|jgi:ABC-type Fe3+-hydroxamate transport system substrate-binding protein|nr:helical backbone metal receptor [Gemmatimonadales bacterium]
MRRWAHRTHLAGLLALAAGAACGRGGRAAPGFLAVTDDAGRTLTLTAPARRIVSLSPAVTELVFALGAGDRLVGRTTWCDYPPATRAVPSVGDGLSPNIEAVAARHPDLVVLYRSPLNETAARQLQRLGITAAVVRQDRLEDVARAARLIGRLVGHEARADSLADALTRLVAQPAPPAPTRVAFVVWDTPPMVIGGGSYLDELATLGGVANVFHDLGQASAVVALETIATRDPDVIAVLRDSAEGGPPAFARRAEWQVIRAVRERRFVYLTGSLFGRPGPRAAQAANELRRLIGATGR